MKKLTVFTAPKPLTDPHINTIQRNAIRSWLEMDEDLEVLLIGDEDGISKLANDLEVKHLPDVKKNEHGTPLVSSIFQLAHEYGQADVLMFSNTDILFFPETLQTIESIRSAVNDFVLLGQRYDLDLSTALDFSAGWAQDLRETVKDKGSLHPFGGSDYFIFPRQMFEMIPEFAIGRAGWDNWMIYHAISSRWLVVDATLSITAVHQNHGYSHLESERGHQRHPETEENLKLAGGMRNMYSLLDVPYQLVNGRIQKAPWSFLRFLHTIELRLQPDELVGSGPKWWLLRGIRKLRRALQKSEVA
jgi:hypothetical protein